MYFAASLMNSIIRPAGAAYKPIRSQEFVNHDIGCPIKSVKNPTNTIIRIVNNHDVSSTPMAVRK